MTIDEFLKLLKKTPRRWEIVSDVYFTPTLHQVPTIRCCGCCPVEVVAKTRAGEWADAAYRLDLAIDDCDRIMAAADGKPNCDLTLRRKLLRACGIKEKKR